jgi:hypothetical protein
VLSKEPNSLRRAKPAHAQVGAAAPLGGPGLQPTTVGHPPNGASSIPKWILPEVFSATGSRVLHRFTLLTVSVLLALCTLASAQGGTVILDFESLSDGDPVTNQFPGLTFSNAIVLSAGISLNEFEFPPHSGVNVISDNGGPITIIFATPILSFSGYFTYAEPLTLAAFDASLAQVASVTSAFSSNDALFGDPGSSPNEFLQVTFAGGISSMVITGDPSGGSFVMDDAAVTSSVPEPTAFHFSLIGLIVLYAHRPKSSL